MWQKPTQNGFGQKRNFDVKKDWNWNWHQSTWILGAQDAIRARSPEGTQLEFLLSWHRCQTGKRGANVSSSTVFFSWKSLRELTQLNTRNTNGPVKECSEELNGHLSKEDVYMANTHMENCSASLTIREMQVKTTTRKHLMPVRMASIKKSTNNNCWSGCGAKGTLSHCWWECKLVQPLQRTVWRFLKKLEIELPYAPEIPLLGIHTEETRNERNTCTPMFIAALFIIARKWKQPRCTLADE